MPTPSNLLPHPDLAAAAPVLQQYLTRMAQTITPDRFLDWCDPVLLNTLHNGFASVAAHEGSVWLVDQTHEYLVNAYNNGPQAERLRGFRQPLSEGIISMVLATEQGFAEIEVYRHMDHSKLVDQALGVSTYAMVAVPFYFVSGCRGVISCVQLTQVSKRGEAVTAAAPLPGGFDNESLRTMQRVAHAVRTLLEHRLLLAALGLDHL
ncbi:MAG: hypothetical protein JO069_18560 [Verrucomicrobia bacterium]|nr:hypothetical protein [Verrucomicrobiota bacterium]